ncbi:hypothetical protein BDN70DRAFT_893305 [Pholiota conissans]|uniref:Uncharacterized protein n=1 Tax=Pholiota conissans TaxID=109636 RepID=A0A9P5Z7D4_9AGAR|nr:hypothetical protein BDN70DRAFT_893305 [Pholiota conissans]
MYIQAELCSQKARSQYSMDQLPEFSVRYQAVLDAFHRDKVNNPTEFPTTPEESELTLDDIQTLQPNELALWQSSVAASTPLDEIYIGMKITLRGNDSDAQRQYTVIDQGNSVMHGNYWSLQEIGENMPIILASDEVLERFVQM